MKKVLLRAKMIAFTAILAQISFSAAQINENPGHQSTPRPSNPPRQNTPPPNRAPQPIIMPMPIYIPGNSGNMGNNPNMQVAPPKTDAQIAAENREYGREQIAKTLVQLSADKEEFEIKDVTKPFEITGAKGFVLYFPEFAFVDEDGNPVLGDVKVKMTEYTSYGEFAAAGLTTMTTDGEILETGGMVNLEATSGDKNVKMAQGKEVGITVPNVDAKKGFQVFYGTGTDQVKWTTNPAQANTKTEEQPFDGYTIKMLKPTGHMYGDNVTMAFYKNDEGLEVYVNKNLKVSNDVKKKILKDGIPFVYTIEFNALGKIKSVVPKNASLTDKSIMSPMNGKIKNVLMDAPAFAMTEGNLMAGKPYDIIFATAKNYTGTEVKIVPPLQFPAKTNENINANPDAKNVNEFTMHASGLTKINADRFSGYNSTDTATFKFDRADALVYIVLKDMKSMIQPNGANGSYYMTKIPANTAVRYVAVVYDDQGGVHIASKDTVFKQGEVKFENNIPFNSGNLKQALEAQ